MTNQRQAAVIGGGAAGLAAAIGLAERGFAVTLVEKTKALGGRARSSREPLDGAWLGTTNLGPHALYAEAERMLGQLGVQVTGGVPTEGLTMQLEGRLAALPTGAGSLLSNPWLSAGDKLALGALLIGLGRMDLPALESVTLADWLEARGLSPLARRVLEALVRVSSYAHAPERLSAGFALAQLLASTHGVRYVDGGWASIIEGLRARAEERGVRIRCGEGARSLEVRGGRLRAVAIGASESLEVDAAVLAVGPSRCAALLGAHLGEGLRSRLEAMTPVRAACLDVVLRELPRRHPSLILGVDRPIYLSVHSNSARLAPEGGGVLALARYLAPSERGLPEHRAQLEALLDQAHPGWRESPHVARWRPTLVVTHALPEARFGGLAGRPGVDVGVAGLAIAGDWVGAEGHLLDASLASAREAVGALARR